MTRHDIPGLLALLSLAFWGITGLPLWSQLGPDDVMRPTVLFLLHVGGLIYTAASRGLT